jgi:hypothetical protein
MVVAVQAVLFIIGFFHVMWQMGTVPVKFDFRIISIPLTAHAIAWSSFLCGVASLLIGLRGHLARPLGTPI